jgi:hypothetical protein
MGYYPILHRSKKLNLDIIKTLLQLRHKLYYVLTEKIGNIQIKYNYSDHAWQRWVGEYPFLNTRIWDSARRLEKNMYRPGTLQCLSFGHTKPLHIGHGGAIILDDQQAYDTIIRMRYDGRDLNISPWQEQKEFTVGYHYKPTPEEAVQGLALLQGIIEFPVKPQFVQYPDLRTITIKD